MVMELDSPPPDAVMVIVPSAAAVELLPIVRLAPCPGDIVAADSFRETPAGAPLAVSASSAVNPFCAAEVNCTVVLAPAASVTGKPAALPEEPASVKVNVGWGVIVSVTGIVTASPPPLTVIAILVAPSVAVAEAAKATEAVPVPGAGSEEGEMVAVTPAGRPETAMEAAELKPPVLFVVSTTEPLTVRAMERLEVLTEAEIDGRLRVNCALLLSEPATPVTTTV
jgi:hypothetical protein